MRSLIYRDFRLGRLSGAGRVNLLTDTVKALLVTADYKPDRAHRRRSDVTGEAAGKGYEAGGRELTGKTVKEDEDAERGVFRAADLLWEDSTLTARGVVLYKARGGDAAADELIAYLDFGRDVSSTDGPFRVRWGAAGILYLG